MQAIDQLFDNPEETLDPVPGMLINDDRVYHKKQLKEIAEVYGQAWADAGEYLLAVGHCTWNILIDALPDAVSSWDKEKSNEKTHLRNQTLGQKAVEKRQLVLVKRGKGRIFGQKNGMTKERLSEIRNNTEIRFDYLDGGDQSEEMVDNPDEVDAHQLVADPNAALPSETIKRNEIIALAHRAIASLSYIEQLVFRLRTGLDMEIVTLEKIAGMFKGWGMKPTSIYGVSVVEERATKKVKTFVRQSLASSAKELAPVRIRGNMLIELKTLMQLVKGGQIA